MTAPLEQYTATAALLGAWAHRREAGQRRPQDRVGALLQAFPAADRAGLRSALRRATQETVHVAHEAGYLLGPAVASGTPVMWPVVAVTADPAMTVGLRIALFFQHEDDVWAHGWRFETADSPAGRHPYLHAQHCRGWGGPSGPLFMDQSHEGLRTAPVNESEPAFPLRGRTCVGLVAATLATLYGATEALAIAGDAGGELRTGLLAEVRSLLTGA